MNERGSKNKMTLEKLIQVKVSMELYNEITREAILSGLTISQICRLRLSNKRIVDRLDLKGENRKFRPVQVQETRRNFE
ncbi:MAG: hypothetical protein Q8N99_03160 [Nanoarchaeota archaeon]|nr:hypothetical protein [Nanoarchaeota archaeon]